MRPPPPTSRSAPQGLFLAFDGGEGCGKSTQATILAGRLREAGREVLVVRDPGTTRVGERVRAILLDPDHAEMAMTAEALLYMAARAQMMHETVRPALDAGQVVITDRFVSSTLAYQVIGPQNPDGLSAEAIRSLADVALGGRWPQLTILLDMPPDAAISRVTRAKDRIEQRPGAYHAAVRENYLKQAADDPDRVTVIDAARPIEAVAADVWRAVAAVARV